MRDLTEALAGVGEGLSVLREALARAGAGDTRMTLPQDAIKMGICNIVLVCVWAGGCHDRFVDITVSQLIDALKQYVEACRVAGERLDPDLELPAPGPS